MKKNVTWFEEYFLQPIILITVVSFIIEYYYWAKLKYQERIDKRDKKLGKPKERSAKKNF